MIAIIIVGELINSTRKSVKEALANKDEAAIRQLAKDQIDGGADIIDVNTATSMENEISDMKWAIGLIYDEVGEVRIAVDSPNPKALAAGLEMCKGRPLINSINNDPRHAECIDVAKSFVDADIIGLPMGGKVAMPKTVEERLGELDIMVNTLEKNGVDLNRLYVDNIVMTIGSNQEQGQFVIDATRETKQRYGDRGVKTSVGLSNVSFGLPKRTLINQAFLAMLLEAGLDMAFIDPKDTGMMNILRASEAILGIDKHCIRYLKQVRQ